MDPTILSLFLHFELDPNDAHHQAASTVDEVMEDVSLQLATITQGRLSAHPPLLPTLRPRRRDLGANPRSRFIFVLDDLCQRRLCRF